jgi:hypothetical protein
MAAVCEGSSARLLTFRPNPFFSTASVLCFGVPVGLYKLGQFEINSNIQKVALQIAGGDFKLSLGVAKLMKMAMDLSVPEPQLGQAISLFVRTHRNALPAGLTAFASAVEDGNLTSVDAARELLSAAEAYGKRGDDVTLAEGIQKLSAILPLQVPALTADDSKLLWRDGIKTGILCGVLLAEWASWSVSGDHKNETTKAEGPNGTLHLASALVSLVIMAVCVNFAVNRQKIPVEK